MADLGKVLIIPKGEYEETTNYSELDLVTYQGSSYLAKKPTLGHLPTDTEYWQLNSYGFSGDATDLSYDNTETQLTATTVQDAIDEHVKEESLHVTQELKDKIKDAVDSVGQINVNEVAVFHDEAGNIKSSGYTIEASVPANAKFTDTIYEHPGSGVTEGDYRCVHVDGNGHVTSGSNPTTLSEYGITDAAFSKHSHDSGDITSLDASKITGIISIDHLPQGALERLIPVPNDQARFALTKNEVQKGDTVKVNDTGIMYYITDDTKLDSEEGYEKYASGTAASAPWSGITGKPNTFPSDKHTHAKDEIQGIDKVENKSSTEILEGLTSANIKKALGFLPLNSEDLNGFKIVPFNSTATTLSELINGMPEKSIMITELTDQISSLLNLPVNSSRGGGGIICKLCNNNITAYIYTNNLTYNGGFDTENNSFNWNCYETRLHQLESHFSNESLQLFQDPNSDVEGGELRLHGASGYQDWVIDVCKDELRFFNESSSTMVKINETGELVVNDKQIITLPEIAHILQAFQNDYLELKNMDDVSEGGQIILKGAGNHPEWCMDVFNDTLRIFSTKDNTVPMIIHISDNGVTINGNRILVSSQISNDLSVTEPGFVADARAVSALKSYVNDHCLSDTDYKIIPIELNLTYPDSIMLWHKYAYQQYNMVYVAVCFQIVKEVSLDYSASADVPFISGFPFSQVKASGNSIFSDGMGTNCEAAPFFIHNGKIQINRQVQDFLNTRIVRFFEIVQSYPIDVSGTNIADWRLRDKTYSQTYDIRYSENYNDLLGFSSIKIPIDAYMYEHYLPTASLFWVDQTWDFRMDYLYAIFGQDNNGYCLQVGIRSNVAQLYRIAVCFSPKYDSENL